MRPYHLQGFRVAIAATILLLATLATQAQVRVLPTHGHNCWRAEGAELDGNPRTAEIVGGTYTGHLVGLDWTGRLLWEVDAGAFPFDLECRDVDNDGLEEIFAALSDGTLLSLTAAGAERFRFRQPGGLPLFQVAAVRWRPGNIGVATGGVGAVVYCLDAAGTLLLERDAADLGVVRFLQACDFDGTGTESLMAASSRIRSHKAMLWEGLSAAPLWRKITGGRGSVDHVTEDVVFLQKGESPAQVVWIGGGKMQPNLHARGSHGATTLLSYTASGQTTTRQMRGLDRFALTDYVESNTKYAMYNTAPLTWKGGNAIAVQQAARVVLTDETGAVLKAGTAPIGFSDIDIVAHEGIDYLLLGASPNGDDNVYVLPIDSDWMTGLADLKPQGRQAAISRNLKKIGDMLTDRPVETIPADNVTDVVVRMYRVNTSEDIRAYWDHIPDFLGYYREHFPSPNIRYGVDLWVGRGSGRLMPEPELLDFFRRLEETRSYYTIFASHGCNVGENNQLWYTPLDLAEKILRAAPTTCMAMYSGEDEKFEVLPGWLDSYWRPMMDLLRRYGAEACMKEKNMFWAMLPAIDAFRERVLTPEYRDTLVPNTEDSNSRTPDVQLAGRVGLWAAGLVDGWGIRLIGDAFSFNRQHEWEYPMTGHPSLRSMIAACALGARNFMFEHGQFGQFTGDVTRDRDFNRVWEESDALFLKLVRTGALRSPNREDLCTLNPVVVAVENPSQRFIAAGRNGHTYYPANPDDGGQYPFSRLDCYWGMAPTHEHDLGRILYGRKRQFGNYIPTTPHGFVTVVPNSVPDRQLPWMTTRVVTNGDRVRIDGRDVPIAECASVLKTLLEQGAEGFPFRCHGDDNIFFQAARLEENRYQIVLIDPGYLDPADHEVWLESGLEGSVEMTDAVTLKPVPQTGNRWPVHVPAGGFRILRAKELYQKKFNHEIH